MDVSLFHLNIFVLTLSGPGSSITSLLAVDIEPQVTTDLELRSVGVGFSKGNPDLGLPISIGIALQNIPEGLVVAVACLAMGYSRKKAFLVCLISGLVEPVGGFFGVLLVSLFPSLLPLGLSFAAGAMLFAILHKMMFEIHNYKMQNVATFSCVTGLMVMTILDRIF